MFHETNFIQHFIANWRKVIFNVLIAGSAFGVLCAAHAQYLFDPSNADEQAPGIRYFGSAKDDKGILIPGVTVSISVGGKTSFVFVTDEQGRFRGNLPLPSEGSAKNDISPKCFKAGYQFMRATQRPGVNAPKPFVQVDCVLHLAASR
jgi:hypothetical protein